MTFDVGFKQYCNYLRTDAIILDRILVKTKNEVYVYDGRVIVHECKGELQIKPLFDDNYPCMDKYYIPAHKNKLEKMLIDTRCRFIKLEKLLNKYLEDAEKEYNKIWGELDEKYILKDTPKPKELDCEICANL